ncbi:MAG: hypothetical protein HFF09_04510 [Oscillospiraceae bacterium]|nr:hypothetical protein [Oscillospiraceae bacterium]
MKKADLKCLRCNLIMKKMGDGSLMLSESTALGRYTSSNLAITAYSCPSCGKLEFFRWGCPDFEDEVVEIECEYCKKLYNIRDRICPHCGK